MANAQILVSAFRPFAGQALNPSQMVLEKLPDLSGQLSKILLPVEFGKAFEALEQRWNENATAWTHLVMLGQAAGRSRISLERVGLNWQETHIADEAGHTPKVGSILQYAPPAMINTRVSRDLPLKLQVHAPTEWSFSAGTYVCNDLYFRALEKWSTRAHVMFIHLPSLPEQAKPGEASMPLEKMLAAVTEYVHLCQAGQA